MSARVPTAFMVFPNFPLCLYTAFKTFQSLSGRLQKGSTESPKETQKLLFIS